MITSSLIIAKIDEKNKVLIKASEEDTAAILELPGARLNVRYNLVTLPSYALPLFVKRFKGRIFADKIFIESYQQQKISFDLVEEIKKLENSGRKDKEWLSSLGLDIKDIALAYDHQRVLLDFFINSGGRILLGDEMGLGKGLESILVAEYLKKYKDIKRVLIICPNSIKYSVWQKEIKRWSNEECVVVDGDKQEKIKQVNQCKAFFLVANYEAVRQYTSSFVNWKPDLVIVDEAHSLKNAKAKQTKAVKSIATPYRVLMSGTPILNRADEIWSLLNYLKPDLWYSYNRFTKTYCDFKDLYIGRGRKIKVISGYKNLDLLKLSIAPIFIRREKREVMKDLPERIYENREIPLNEEQVKRYNELVLDFKTKINGKEIKITKQLLIVQLSKLLQICDTLACLNSEHDVSSKLDELETIIEENIEKHKMVIFTWFKATAKAAEERILKKKISIVRIDGDVPLDIRTEYIKNFQSESLPKVLVATIASCGLGVTLTAADICIFVSRSYVPALNSQAEARLHRPGQRNVVSIINLYAQGTAEDKVRELLEKKQQLFDEFTTKDLEGLVTEII